MTRKSIVSALPEDKLPARVRWDQRYSRQPSTQQLDIAPWLAKWLPRLPTQGPALDIAAGAGRHAIALARHGLQVDAVDISIRGLGLLQAQAEPDLPIRPIVLDLALGWLPLRQYQVIANFFFLERAVWPAIRARLAPGGWLIFETFTIDQLHLPTGQPIRREFLLEQDELLGAFADLEIVVYETHQTEQRATACLLARRPA